MSTSDMTHCWTSLQRCSSTESAAVWPAVLVEPAPVGDQLQYLTLPEEGVFALLLAPASTAIVRWLPVDCWELVVLRRALIMEEDVLTSCRNPPLWIRPLTTWPVVVVLQQPAAVLGQPLNGLQPQPAGQLLPAAHSSHSSSSSSSSAGTATTAATAVPQCAHPAQLEHRWHEHISQAAVPRHGGDGHKVFVGRRAKLDVRGKLKEEPNCLWPLPLIGAKVTGGGVTLLKAELTAGLPVPAAPARRAQQWSGSALFALGIVTSTSPIR
ncbi:hypothetical protein EYF80_027464 [Liparis tanakae]|uniref:Uncharacterized protein n=1 Tax=Liparis tanakae TaxID=230148 RepID=A0A4Z2H8X9_9TELE|nr:hypothetical protein EYF80_027464 [Liparis tanakae]